METKSVDRFEEFQPGRKKKKIPWTFYEDNGSQDIIEKLIQENLPELEDTQNQIK